MDRRELCSQVAALSKEIGEWMVTERIQFSENDVENKTFNNLVSYVDKESEKRFVEGLLKLLPGSGILGEEGSSINLIADYIWIIDPLDGTTNYVHGVPAYCTSVALQHKKQTVIGVVYEPNQKECFYSYGDGSFLNAKEISVSKNAELSNSLLATGFPYYNFEKTDKYLSLFKDLMQGTRGIRRIGAAALDLCYVACGRFEAFYEYALHPWDVAAGAFIVQNAGGQVSEFDKGANFDFGEDIIASNTLVHLELQSKISKYFLGEKSYKIIRKSALNSIRWSGGISTELYIFPETSDYKKGDFDFRISTATVEIEESVFTPLPDLNRTLMVLSGEMKLIHQDQHNILLKPFEKDNFNGGWNTKSEGTCVDLNLMTKGNCEGDVRHLFIEKSSEFNLSTNKQTVLYPYKGEISISLENHELKINEGDVLIINEASTIKVESESSDLIWIEIF
ncbi:MAG: myo-inositol-1(or 4)-monophosphatase [Flavobacteriales bacterium]|jgi:myo-inositol-1(or 4)-monophosphatase